VIQTLLRGFVFGIGFSFAVVLTGAAMVSAFRFFQNDLPAAMNDVPVTMRDDWQGLTDDEQIALASALVIGRYEPGPDDSRVGFAKEIYADSPAVEPKLVIGAEIPGSRYYPDKHDTRSGLILLFVEGSEHPKTTLFMYGDRIPGFGDMPLELLIKKFEADGA